MGVVVVTDSSSRLSSGERTQWDIRQVPLHVLVEGTDLRDGVDEVPADVHEHTTVSTAGATPAELADAYRQALRDSHGDGVVAVHISAALSSTFGTAVAVAREFGPAVRVVNTRSAAMGVGFVALTAAAEVKAFIVVRRLDNLRRSGRIRTTASWLGTALSLKPLLCLDVDGRLVLDQRIRTATKAQAALVARVAEEIGDRWAAIAVHHVDNSEAAQEISDELRARIPNLESLIVTEMGPVLAVHVGGGAVGVALRAVERGAGEEISTPAD